MLWHSWVLLGVVAVTQLATVATSAAVVPAPKSIAQTKAERGIKLCFGTVALSGNSCVKTCPVGTYFNLSLLGNTCKVSPKCTTSQYLADDGRKCFECDDKFDNARTCNSTVITNCKPTFTLKDNSCQCIDLPVLASDVRRR
ncbi:hypothetical protein OIV83_004230 [Microbotryomycetes sp. JL201]|nr:hypothetical protein OIV83_004230 [Microbotryomycetes sp. JL201]